MTMKLMKADDAAAVTADITDDASNSDLARIGEIAAKYGVTLRTLRFYEDKGLLSPQRDGNTRLYTRREEVRLKLILLGRKVGFSLRDVKQMLDLYEPQGSNVRQLRLALDKSEKQLGRLTKQRQAIDEAIGELNDAMEALRAKLAEVRPVPVAANG